MAGAGAAALAASPRLPGAAPANATVRQRPNVIIVLLDDVGYADFSCHGNPVIKTPNVDRLHGESIRLTDFHVAPMCTPTRSQLMTGVDCLRNGAMAVATERIFLRRGIPTAADVFAANGYRTGQFGKWHLGDTYPYRPQDRGFEEVLYFHLANIGQSDDYWCNDYFDPHFRRADGKPVQFEGYCTDILFSEAMKWMRQRTDKGEPFFCYLPLNAAHGPLYVPQKYREPYKDQRPNVASFFGMIANIDENMGRLDAVLRETGLRNNTILIFMTDNGGTAGVPVFNAGMRGRKTELYDGGHRVPCFIRWPGGRLRAAGDIAVLTEDQDILPTLVDLCGLKKPESANFDGASLARRLRGKEESMPVRMLVVQYGRPVKWNATVMWNRWRLVRGEELYDLATDPAQKKNVIAERAVTAAKMREHYELWWAGIEPLTLQRSPIVVGSDVQNPTPLTPSYHLDRGMSNAAVIRQGVATNDVWYLEVAREGDYEIALRRWPVEADAPIRGSVPAWRSQDKDSPNPGLPEGKALPIARARLQVADFKNDLPVGEKDKAAVFNLPLKGGRTNLLASFLDDQGKDLCGAYYVYVRRK